MSVMQLWSIGDDRRIVSLVQIVHKMIAVVFGARVIRETGSYAATYQSALNTALQRHWSKPGRWLVTVV